MIIFLSSTRLNKTIIICMHIHDRHRAQAGLVHTKRARFRGSLFVLLQKGFLLFLLLNGRFVILIIERAQKASTMSRRTSSSSDFSFLGAFLNATFPPNHDTSQYLNLHHHDILPCRDMLRSGMTLG